MTPKIMGYSVTAFVVMAVVCGSEVQAQEAGDAHTRNDCRLAAQIIRTGHPAPHVGWAYSAIQRCELTGTAVLAERWRTVPDSAEAQLLASASWRFPKRLIFDAVAAVAENDGANSEARLQAMALLVNFAETRVSLNMADLRNPRLGRRPRIMSGSHTASYERGELCGVRAQVVSALGRARDASSSESLRRIANEYIRFLELSARSHEDGEISRCSGTC